MFLKIFDGVSMGIRLAALLIAALPLTLLMVARQLEPDEQGLGTHQQLGLPPCSLRVLLGVRCPACGMTTSWAHFTRGQWSDSALVNLGGFLLALFSIAVAALAVRAVWSGKLPSLTSQRVLLMVLLGIGAVTLTDWVRRLIG